MCVRGLPVRFEPLQVGVRFPRTHDGRRWFDARRTRTRSNRGPPVGTHCSGRLPDGEHPDVSPDASQEALVADLPPLPPLDPDKVDQPKLLEGVLNARLEEQKAKATEALEKEKADWAAALEQEKADWAAALENEKATIATAKAELDADVAAETAQ